MTKANSVLSALKNGEELTAAQIKSRFSVGNPHEVIRTLREEGYAIYLNERTNSKGVVTAKYRLGAPSRKMVALAYAAFGKDAFTRAA